MEEKETSEDKVVESANTGLAEVELDDVMLAERRRILQNYQLNKDDTDIQLAEMEKQLDLKIPSRLLDESIAELEEDIKNRKVRKNKGGQEVIEDATDVEVELMRDCKLATLKKMKELDIPMRDLRLQISQLRFNKGRPDAPEQQISKLEREIREKKMTVPASRASRPLGVG